MWTLKLLRFNQVPFDYREPFIISGYRSCRSSLSACLASTVHRTNETFNFWTHFVPFIVFAVITWRHVVYGIDDRGNVFGVQRKHDHGQVDVDGVHFLEDPFAWPLIVFLLATCSYMLASAVAHLFNSMSWKVRQILFFVDYCGISMFSFGCCIAYFAYIFPPELLSGSLYAVYLPVASVAAVASTYLACYSRYSHYVILNKGGRLPSFMIPYIWCSIPLLYRVIFCQSTGCDTEARLFHNRQFLFCVLVGVFYSTRFPESVFPGTFDIIGHSHQMFHIGTVIASYSQYRALLEDAADRRELLVGLHGLPTVASTFGLWLTALAVNLVVIWRLAKWVTREGEILSTRCEKKD